jgi:hypothetical protein
MSNGDGGTLVDTATAMATSALQEESFTDILVLTHSLTQEGQSSD